MRKIYYNSHAGPDVYALIRDAMPPGYELAALDSDSFDERVTKIRDCEVAICASTPLRASLIDAAAKLELVHHQGVGYHDTVDVDALKRRGIPLALTPEGTSTSVAEHTVLLMLAVCRRLPFADAELRAGRFHINALRPVSRELAGLTIGYVGMGRIAQEVAARLKPFAVRGLYCDPYSTLDTSRAEALGLHHVDSLDHLLPQADIVTLHLPLTAESRHLFNDAAFARMKPGAFLINTARGSLVDEAALLRALACGRLSGAGLDVFESEPLGKGSPLCALANVVLTPHISAGTRDALATKMRAVFDNVERFFRGEPLRNQVAL